MKVRDCAGSPDSLPALEHQRSAILAQIVDLGDFRSGSITAINGPVESPTAAVIVPASPATAPTTA
jgi:hypothetical protein